VVFKHLLPAHIYFGVVGRGIVVRYPSPHIGDPDVMKRQLVTVLQTFSAVDAWCVSLPET
jgi:hypothetical protein